MKDNQVIIMLVYWLGILIGMWIGSTFLGKKKK